MLPPDSPGNAAWERLARGGGEGPEGGREQAVRYRFGDYFFDTERYELHRAGMLVPLRPKECGRPGLYVPSSAVPMPPSTGMLWHRVPRLCRWCPVVAGLSEQALQQSDEVLTLACALSHLFTGLLPVCRR